MKVRTTANDAETKTRSNSRAEKHTRNAQTSKSEISNRFGTNFGAILGPRGSKIGSRLVLNSKRCNVSTTFRILHGDWIWGDTWWSTVGEPKEGYRTLQRTSKFETLYVSRFELRGDLTRSDSKRR